PSSQCGRCTRSTASTKRPDPVISVAAHNGALQPYHRLVIVLACGLHTAFDIGFGTFATDRKPGEFLFDNGRRVRAPLRSKPGPRISRHAWSAWRSARVVATASRSDGGAGQRAGTP